ncbi:MAG TPA: hypothetical protein VFH68_18265 [Polyangia bacterium]|nr:hypothetical protein [Polyangia bacterium]
MPTIIRLPFALTTLMLLVGCASSPAPLTRSRRELVIGYDDNRPRDVIAFPTATYETVTRFDLPAGEHHPLRLRLQAAAQGALEINFYDSTPLETPGQTILTVSRFVGAADVSNGTDGRWMVEELGDAKPLSGVVWVGVRKTSGDPTVWSSGAVSSQSFIRNNDPQNPIPLLPIKRSPMLRLELAP